MTCRLSGVRFARFAPIRGRKQRDGWRHKDTLLLAHVKPTDERYQAILKWVVDTAKGVVEPPENSGEDLKNWKIADRIKGHVLIQPVTNPKEGATLIRKYGLVRESVPTELLKSPEVWEALLEKMPVTAMIRNLGNMSKCGLLAPMSEASKKVVEMLGNTEALKKARVHPIQILVAQKTYESGKGVRGKGEWTMVPQVVDALDGAY